MRTRGRATRPLDLEMVRDLSADDLASLETERGVKPVPLTRLRERHHSLARALASGMTDGQAAAITGYEPGRVSLLKSDPTFKDLVTFYREEKDAEYVQLHAALAGVSLDATNEIRERLEDDPESLSVGQLIEISKMGADRTGHAPNSSGGANVNVTLNFAERLEAARKRVAGPVIEGEVVPDEVPS